MSFSPSQSSLLFLTISFFFFFIAQTSSSSHLSHSFPATGGGDVTDVETRRSLVVAAETLMNSSSALVLAQERSSRTDPLDGFKDYTGGWNMSNVHYWASVAWTVAPHFVISCVWFVIFGIVLILNCFWYFRCPKEPYGGYSRIAYALSLIFLIFFTVVAIVGCIVLYTGQAKFHSSTTKTLHYVVNKADTTVENLRNLSVYLGAAKKIGVDTVFLPADVQSNIDTTLTKINSAANTLSDKTKKNAKRIDDDLGSIRLALIVLAAVMLFLTFLGFLLSILGMQGPVYFLVFVGFVLVTSLIILWDIFFLAHTVVADACVSMDEWVQHPTAHTALDDLLPCVDNATAQETSTRAKDTTYKLVRMVDTIINNVSNINNVPPQIGQPLFFNQSGPLIPVLCNPYNSNLTDKKYSPG